MDGQETGSALDPFHGIQFRDRKYRMFLHESLEILICAADAAGLVDFEGNGFLLADPEADLPGQIDVLGSKEAGICIIVKGLLTAVDEAVVGGTDMMNGLAVQEKRAYQAVELIQFRF